MKKIILAFEGAHFSEGAFEFARRINEKNKILLTGLFLPQVILANLWSYADSGSGAAFIPLVEDEEGENVRRNIERFRNLCTKNHIEHQVHKDFFDFALPELKRETRFADLAILGSESFYKNIGTDKPNDYLKEALHATECPVIIVPEKYNFPTSNILAYDGSESSVFAIKQFAYLLPELAANPTLLITISHDESTPTKDQKNVEELASRHFPELTIMNVHLDSKKYFVTWLTDMKNSILVSGSFGRSTTSLMLKRSFVADVISDHQVPVFISHK